MSADNLLLRRFADRLRDRIASRLITSLIPSGKVLFYDDLSAGSLKWGPVYVGTGTLSRVTTDLFDSSGSMQLMVTAGANDSTEARRFLGENLYKLSPLGLEFWFNLNAMATDQIFEFGFERADGSATIYSAYLRYLNSATPVWQVDTPAGWVTFANVPICPQGKTFHYQHAKMVADLVTRKYCWAELDGIIYDLSAYSTITWAAVRRDLELFLWLQNSGVATAQTAWFSDIIGTCFEPSQMGAF